MSSLTTVLRKIDIFFLSFLFLLFVIILFMGQDAGWAMPCLGTGMEPGTVTGEG